MMFRSGTKCIGASGVRSLATDAAPAGAPTPPQAPTPPPRRGGFFRRATPLALSAGAGYFLYKVGTDQEFRASVENSFPASAKFFDMLPTASPPPSLTSSTMRKEAAAKMEGSQNTGAATLPPSYDNVSDILLKIEEANSSVANADSPAAQKEPSVPKSGSGSKLPSIEDMTPSARAAAKVKNESPPPAPVGDGPVRPAKVAQSPTLQVKPKPVEVAPAKKDVPETTVAEIAGTAVDIGNDLKVDATQTEKKGKLARILGKGDFDAESVKGRDVVDNSEYMKPGAKPTTGPVQRNREKAVSTSALPPRRAPWKKSAAKPPQAIAQPASSAEIEALRAELESQTRWEAVRLQEAVRAQMVEDKKIAAKEAAATAQTHSEELARVREEALRNANKVLAERTKEVKEKTEQQRDAELAKLLKAKEDDLRESLVLEYANKEREEAQAREKALSQMKAEVTVLTEQFDSVVKQTERAKEAAKRASQAFLLRESVGMNRPLARQLSEATDKSELGTLVAASVPGSALKNGVCTLEALKTDFQRASRRGLSVAMVPEGKTGTLWGQLLGAIFARLKVQVDSRMENDEVPKSNEARIRLAQHLVEEGDFGGAVATLESLDGLSAQVMADWIGAARARIAADLAADVLLADAIIAQLALTREDKVQASSA